MPPRKKAAPVNIESNATPDPSTTRTVRSSARLASQAIAVAANSDPTADRTTSSEPASKAKTTKSASSAKPKRTKAEAGGNEDDTPASKKQKIATAQEEEEGDAMDVDSQDGKKGDKKDDKKMVISVLCP